MLFQMDGHELFDSSKDLSQMVVFGQSWPIQLTSVMNITKQHHRPTMHLWLIDLCAYDRICANYFVNSF